MNGHHYTLLGKETAQEVADVVAHRTQVSDSGGPLEQASGLSEALDMGLLRFFSALTKRQRSGLLQRDDV